MFSKAYAISVRNRTLCFRQPVCWGEWVGRRFPRAPPAVFLGWGVCALVCMAWGSHRNPRLPEILRGYLFEVTQMFVEGRLRHGHLERTADPVQRATCPYCAPCALLSPTATSMLPSVTLPWKLMSLHKILAHSPKLHIHEKVT